MNIALTLIIDPDAIRLAKELDGLPHALATAGAYLNQVAINISEYLRLYKTSWLKLHKTSPELSSYDNRTLYSTWQLSLDHVKQQNELSAKFLQFWAYFNNQDIWFELLRHSDSEDPQWICELTEDELNFNSAVRVLCDHGVVEADTSSQDWVESKGYGMHSCVHLWTIYVLNQEWDYNLARLAVKCVGSHVIAKEANKWWLIQRRLLQHVARCLYIILNDMIRDDGMESAYHNLDLLFANQGKLEDAKKMYQRALQGYEKALGPDHPSTLLTVNNLGKLYADQGKLGEAEKMFERALQGYEKALGAEHTSTLLTVNNLGLLYKYQGKLGEAGKMFERALQGYEEALGHERVNTYIPALNTTENFAMLYVEIDRADKAGNMYSRALYGLEAVLGRSSKRCQDIIAALAVLNGDRR